MSFDAMTKARLGKETVQAVRVDGQVCFSTCWLNTEAVPRTIDDPDAAMMSKRSMLDA